MTWGLMRYKVVAPAIIIAIMLIALQVAVFVLRSDLEDEDEWEGGLRWNISGCGYLVQIISVENTSASIVGFELITPGGAVATIVGPNGSTIILEGLLTDILFNQSAYDQAYSSNWPDPTSGTQFYADPERNNLTLYIAFMDTDSSMGLSMGDYIWIRSVDNGGPADDQYRFRLVHTEYGKEFGSLVCPATS